MKKIFTAILAVLLTVTIAGCKSSVPVAPGSTVYESKYDIASAPVDGTVTSYEMDFTVTNNTDLEMLFGSEYYIQVYRDNSWCDLDVGVMDWTAEGYCVNPGDTGTFTVKFSYPYGELVVGTYRMIKPYDLMDATETRDSFFFCEFEVL